jgi:ABC-type sugar transport system ATPase subunit
MNESGMVRLEGISKTYPGSELPAVEDVNLEIDAGSFFSLLGPSGCGKTTTLRIIAGFEYPNNGRVYIGGRDVTGLSPRDRDIAMVFQDYALYPHMSVEANIGFNLRNRKVPRREVARRVRDTAEKLNIANLLRKKPGQLSGGERQRVALGRALVRQPQVFLLDEPLSNLDLKLREVMRIELGRLHQELGITTIYVTHDQAEAMTLSTRLAVMSHGRFQQMGAPDEVYARPATTFVARFIGSPSMNLFEMQRDDELLRAVGAAGSTLPLPRDATIESGAKVLVGVRPHDLGVLDDSSLGIPVVVSFTEHLGRNNFVVCAPRDSDAFLYGQEAIQVETPAGVTYEPGAELMLTAKPQAIRLFGLGDGAAIGADGPSQTAASSDGTVGAEAAAPAP